MAKGIYVGAEGERAVSGDIIPKTWSVVTEDDEYISDNGIILKVGAGSMDSKPATNACDGSVDTYWQTTATTGAWLRLQFPEKKKITKMKLRATASTSSRVSKIDIRGRNEGGTWIDLYSTTTAQTALTEVTLSNTDYYQYYIVNVTLSSSNYVEIYDWQTSEYVEESTNGVAKKVTKAYVGVSEPEKLINFTSCPYSSADTDWVRVDASLYKHSFTNEYGTWTASGTDVSSSASSYLPYRALENLSNDNYGWAITTTLGEHILTLDFPQDILINPSKIHLKGTDNGYANTYIYGIKEDGSEEVLLDEYFNGNDFETDIDVVTNSYFSKLKLVWDCSKSSSTSKVNYIYELHVNEGTIKVAGYSNKARKIKKGYIGVNGVARWFYDGRTLNPTSQLFFETYTYTDGSKTITGKATTTLQDGTRPTLNITTTSTKGFYHSTSASSGYTSLYSTDTSGNKNTNAAYFNNVLKKTSYSSSVCTYLTSPSGESRTTGFIFDFKELRKLTLNVRMSDSKTTGCFYGSNDGSTWTKIGDIANGTNVVLTSSVAYRYYKVENASTYQTRIYYMYFTNVDDWN